MSDSGGAGGTRTPYLILAKDALSLMSYSPTIAVLAALPRIVKVTAFDEEVRRSHCTSDE